MIYLRLNSVLFHRAREIGWQIAYYYRELGMDMVAMKKGDGNRVGELEVTE